MSWSRVAHATASGTTSMTTAAINTTGADILFVGISGYDGSGPTLQSLSDSKSNTWHPLTTQKGSGGANDWSWETLYYAWNPTVGTSHTFSATGASGFVFAFSMAVAAFSGAQTSSDPLRSQTGAHATAGSTTIQPGSTGTSGDLLVSLLAMTDGSTTVSIDSGFTISDQVAWANSVNEGVALAYLTATGAINPTWTISGSPTADCATTLGSFKPAAVAFTAVNRRTLGPRVGSRSFY